MVQVHQLPDWSGVPDYQTKETMMNGPRNAMKAAAMGNKGLVLAKSAKKNPNGAAANLAHPEGCPCCAGDPTISQNVIV